MRNFALRLVLCGTACLWLVALSGCQSTSKNRVVLYCSVDEVYAKPIIQDLERKTGLQIEALYDTEAAKTAGLANRIRAEKNRPQGDVFWSSALLQTLLLQREGLLQPYQSPSARDIPAAFKDAEGAWTALGVRPRVIVYYEHIKDKKVIPDSLQGLLDPRLKNRIGISDPQFGTGSDWAAALATRWGMPKTLDYFKALKQNGVRVLPGNSVVAEKVARGEIWVGVTDSDDYLAQGRRTGNIGLSMPGDPQVNAMLIPGSIAIMKGAPHAAGARKLIDALLATATEKQLVAQMPGVLPLRGPVQPISTGVTPPLYLPHDREHMPDDSARWPAAWDKIREPLAEILLSD